MAVSLATCHRHPDVAKVRELKGISLEQISQDSKIRVYYLRAIEEGRLDKLPGGVFTTSYLRQYARAIGYPEAEMLAAYHRSAS